MVQDILRQLGRKLFNTGSLSMTKLFRLVILLLALSCGYANRVADWPQRGSLVTVINDSNEPVSIVAKADNDGTFVVRLKLWPMSRTTFRWPWIGETGQLYAQPLDRQIVYTTRIFKPWSSDYWCWKVSEAVPTVGQCKD